MLTGPMEAAFFDLDKTVIAKSSVLAFGRPLYREGLLSRSALLKSAYNQAIYRLRGADETRMQRARDRMLSVTRGWDQAHVAGIVGDTFEKIVTPMLICHGNRDYRVPLGEALRLWWDLARRWEGEPDELPHRFLQLTGENHWVLSPGNAQIWWETLLGFCERHVLR